MPILSKNYIPKNRMMKAICLFVIVTLVFTAFFVDGPIKADSEQWTQDSNGWKYQNTDGTYITDDWVFDNDAWYYLSSDGYMETGWITDDALYYLDESGRMVTGEIEIDGQINSFDNSGKWIGYKDGSAVTQQESESRQVKWTVMVYMTGSDLETRSAAATTDITEMLRSELDPEQVQVIIATGGSEKWFSDISNNTVDYYQVYGDSPSVIAQNELSSMGDPSTLTSFLDYSYQNYPAEKYALILWDHGGGPMEGVCLDELFINDGKKDALSLEELGQALSASAFSESEKLEFIGFDACLMASAETAYTCKPFARYMIASEEMEPNGGWNYGFIGNLNIVHDGAEAGISIIDDYYETYKDDVREQATLSCIDLSKIDDLENDMDNLFFYLDTIITPESFSGLTSNRENAKEIGRKTGSEYDLVDVFSLAEKYLTASPEAAKQVMDAVHDAVVYEKSNLEGTYGLSLYYPHYNKEYFESKWKEQYARIGFSEGYKQYLNDYANIWLGKPLADFSGIVPQTEYNEEVNGVDISFTLTPEQEEHFAEAQLIVLSETDGYYNKINESTDIQNNGDGVYSSTYYGGHLSAVDENNNKLEWPITYYLVDDFCFVHAILRNEDDVEQHVWLQCRIDADTWEIFVEHVIPIDDLSQDPYTLYTGKQENTFDPDEWPYISFTLEGTFSEEYRWKLHDEILSLELHDSSSESEVYKYYSSYDGISNSEMKWKLSFFKGDDDFYNNNNLYAYIVIRDTQGNVFKTQTVAVNKNEPELVTQTNEIGNTEDELSMLRNSGLYAKTGFYAHVKGEDTQQKTIYALLGSDVELEVEISGNADNVKYQWYEYEPNPMVEKKTAIDRADLSSYTVLNVENDYQTYLCEVTVGVYSQKVIFELIGRKIIIEYEGDWDLYQQQPKGSLVPAKYISVGDSVPIQIKATSWTEGPLEYKWEVITFKDGAWDYAGKTTIDGATLDTYTVENVQTGCECFCTVTDQNGDSSQEMFCLFIDNGFSAKMENQTVSVKKGGNAELKVNAACKTGNIAYDWSAYDQNNHMDKLSASVNDESVFEVSNIQNPLKVICHVYDEYGNEDYLYFNIEIDNGLNIDAEESPAISIKSDGTITFQVNASCSEGAISYQWYMVHGIKNGNIDTTLIDSATDKVLTLDEINAEMIDSIGTFVTDGSWSIPENNQELVYICVVTDEAGNTKNQNFIIELKGAN